ncbi:MAG TPA: Clp protease N-terminal domain-containing protein, partial [Fimbriimonas sp.]|nr:Clp protease N-terminal domain-containing protein [Fimbriimonas sp.]
DSTACVALTASGIDLIEVGESVERQLPRGDARPSQDMTLTPRAKRVIDLAYDEARNLNNNYIGSEHMLLGLVREGDGLAGRVLGKFGVELEAIRNVVMTLQVAKGDAADAYGETPRPMSATASATELLSIRQRKSLYDRFAIMLLADDMSAAQLVRDLGLSPARIQTAIEDLLFPSPGVRAATGLEPHTLEELFAAAAALSAPGAPTGAHLFVAIALDEKASLSRVLASMGCDLDVLKAGLAE